MSSFETVLYEKRGALAFVTLNRPRFLNAFNIQMRDELWDVLRAVRDDDEVRVALLMGAGEKAFCAGADLSEFLSAPEPVAAREIRFDRNLWKLFLSIPQPMIAVLHGHVLGSGLEMALCCDLRLASEDAQFRLPEVQLGIIPAAGGTQTLPRVVGVGPALEMVLLGESVGADRALEINLVNQVVPREKLIGRATEIAERIASFDPRVVRCAKKAIVEGLDMPLVAGLNLEGMLASICKRREQED